MMMTCHCGCGGGPASALHQSPASLCALLPCARPPIVPFYSACGRAAWVARSRRTAGTHAHTI